MIYLGFLVFKCCRIYNGVIRGSWGGLILVFVEVEYNVVYWYYLIFYVLIYVSIFLEKGFCGNICIRIKELYRSIFLIDV